jgi:hypothetical protein
MKRILFATLVLTLLIVSSASAYCTLVRFEAHWQNDGTMLVVWETSAEVDSTAFFVYQAGSLSGPWTDCVDFEPAVGNEFTGATYSFVDTEVIQGNTYYYRLEETAADGTSSFFGPIAPYDGTYQSLPFSQNWANTGLITADDDWSGVPGIIGFRGDNLTAATGVDPQTVLVDDTPGVVDVNANRTDPDTFTTGGVAEFELADPTVALNGSGTADAPYLLIHLDTTGFQSIRVQYNLRDLDGSADNAVQQVALQYRVGASGNFTNVPAAYVADATTGGTATQVTPVDVVLDAAADDQAQLQLRIITTNAVGNDEWVGVDDISVSGTPNNRVLLPLVVR